MKIFINSIVGIGDSIIFLKDIIANILKGKVRFAEVLKQIYIQGVQSIIIVSLTSLASGVVLALQGYVAMVRFGAKEYIAHLVALSLVRELGPVFTAIIFSAKAGARVTAELGTMNVNDQILATRTLGVDPVEFLVVPRVIACFIVLPILTIMSEIIGIFGGYLVGVYQARIPSAFYINQTFRAIKYVDFFSGFAKVFFFGIIIGLVCSYKGFITKGGSLGVGKFTTEAVAYSIILVLLSDVFLTKVILTFWG